jgi:hypothetical protein
MGFTVVGLSISILGNEADIFSVETGIYQLLHCGMCFGSAIEQTNDIRHSDSPSYDA